MAKTNRAIGERMSRPVARSSQKSIVGPSSSSAVLWALRDDGDRLSLRHQLPNGLPLVTLKCMICLRSPATQPPRLAAFILKSGGRGNISLLTKWGPQSVLNAPLHVSLMKVAASAREVGACTDTSTAHESRTCEDRLCRFPQVILSYEEIFMRTVAIMLAASARCCRRSSLSDQAHLRMLATCGPTSKRSAALRRRPRPTSAPGTSRSSTRPCWRLILGLARRRRRYSRSCRPN